MFLQVLKNKENNNAGHIIRIPRRYSNNLADCGERRTKQRRVNNVKHRMLTLQMQESQGDEEIQKHSKGKEVEKKKSKRQVFYLLAQRTPISITLS